MAKNDVSDFSSTPGNNTDIGNISIVGTAQRSNFDNAFRELMAQLADVWAGTSYVFDTFTFSDPADLTKRFRFDGGGVTAGQTRVLTVPDYNGTIATLAGTETFTNKTYSGGTASGVTITGGVSATFVSTLTLTATSDGASGAVFIAQHISASPAASDVIFDLASQAKDSAGNTDTYGDIQHIILDPTSTSEDSVWAFFTRVAGTLAERLRIGAGLYMQGATGGDQGAGTLNATAVYDDGVALITAAGVPTATAALAVGGIGTYAFLRQASGAVRAAGYSTVAANLQYSDDAGGNGSAPAAGTWMLMGELVNANSASLWLRIS